MSRWLRNPFSRPARRPAAPSARPPVSRLAMERLDDRLTPSASAVLSADHLLTVTAQGSPWNQGDQITVTRDLFNPNKVSVLVNYWPVASFDAANPVTRVDRVKFVGTDHVQPFATGADTFTNQTSLPGEYRVGHGLYSPTTVYGGAGANSFYATDGMNVLRGGAGTNFFYDTANCRTTAFAGTGANILVRDGEISNSALQVRPTNAQDGPLLAAGLTGNPYFLPWANLTPGNGKLTAVLDAGSGLLTLSGPTGVGFKLKGAWTDALGGSAGQYTHTFTATGPVTLKSGSVLGDLTFSTGGQPVRITTKPSVLAAPVGEFGGMTWAGGLPLSTAGSSPLGSVLGDMGLGFGGNGLAWGIALGSDLKAGSTGLKDAPLNNAVPYLYVSAGSGDGSGASVSYGGLSASVGTGAGVHLALDPADPFFYAKAATGTVVGTWSAGYSQHGVIPFTPVKSVPGFGASDLFGNVYVKADGISLGDLPATVSGEVVLDLDANNDNQAVRVQGRSLGQLLKSGGTALGSVLDDVAVGVNGAVNLGYELGGMDLTIPAASASLMYAPGRIGFHGGHDNPFAGTPLEKFAPRNGEIDMQGSIYWGNGWGFNLTATQSQGYGSLFGSAMTYTISNTGIAASIDFDLDLSVATAHAHADLSLQYVNHALTLHAGLHGDFRAGTDGFNLHGSLDLELDLSTDFHGVDVSGSGRLSGGITAFGVSSDIGVGFRVDNHGFAIDLPLTSKDLVVRW